MVQDPIAPRSRLVDVVAWIYLILGGFMLVTSIAQNLMFHLVFPTEVFTEDIPDGMPGAAAFMFENFHLFILLPLFVSTAFVASSIGLIKRREWARKLFVGLMVLSVVWCFAGFGFQVAFISGFPTPPPSAGVPNFAAINTIMLVFSLLFSVAFSVLFGWIARRLMSWEVRREFRG